MIVESTVSQPSIALLANKIRQSLKKFNFNLHGKKVLTEAATGNYVITPILAALAGAEVFALTRDSKYGSVKEVSEVTHQLAVLFNVEDKIKICVSLKQIPLSEIDIVTNTGFVRPINSVIIYALPSHAIILLMYEAWEFRSEDIDLTACKERGICVYATDESDQRVRTLDYLGYTVLKLLLDSQCAPLSSKVLLVGCEEFVKPVASILKQNNYLYDYCNVLEKKPESFDDYDAIVFLEHKHNQLLFGLGGFIEPSDVKQTVSLIHICGKVDKGSFKKYYSKPFVPADFGYMSYTVDHVDSQAVIDLHAVAFEIATQAVTEKNSNLMVLQ